MATLNRRTYRDRRTGKMRKTRKWYAFWTDAQGRPQRKPLSTDKHVAQQMLADILREVERGKTGARDVFAAHRDRPLAEHLADWEASLADKGSTDKQVGQVVMRAKDLMTGCGFVFWADVQPSRVQSWLAKLRTKHRRASKPASAQTRNFYLSAAKQFLKWLVDDLRAPHNPLAPLKGGGVRSDRRHDRQTLGEQQLLALFAAAAGSDWSFRGLTGNDRHHLYLAACVTGFRAGELASLAPESFALDASPPTVVLGAATDKRRKPVVQPIPSEAAAALQDYLAGKPAGKPVWPGTWHERAADMLKHDLEGAGLPYVVEGPDGPLHADFHALRHSYIALLDRAGVTLKQAMQLARHSDPRLTMAVYGRAQLHDLGAAVDRLPDLAAGKPLARDSVRSTPPSSAGDRTA